MAEKQRKFVLKRDVTYITSEHLKKPLALVKKFDNGELVVYDGDKLPDFLFDMLVAAGDILPIDTDAEAVSPFTVSEHIAENLTSEQIWAMAAPFLRWEKPPDE